MSVHSRPSSPARRQMAWPTLPRWRAASSWGCISVSRKRTAVARRLSSSGVLQERVSCSGMAWPGGSWGSVDAAFAALPVGFAQLEFLQLAGGRQRQLGAELHRARALVARDAFAAVGDDLGLGQRLALARDDHGVHALAPAFVGAADDGPHGQLGRLRDWRFELRR